MNNLDYKKVEENDKEQVFNIIEIVLNGLENKEYFIPYEQWELDSMFDDKNYAPLYGAYDGDKLVRNGSICELGGNLVLPEYRGNGITTKLQTIEMELAKELKFDYIISMAHPDNISSQKTLEKVGLNFVKETRLSNGFLRKLYMKKLKQI